VSYPFVVNRTPNEILADEAITRRARKRELEMTRLRGQRYRERKALLALSPALPDTIEFARAAGDEIVRALNTAYLTRGVFKALPEHLPVLRRNGLADVRLPYLTAFGMAVRRALMEIVQ
jgi:hypothetical protein